MTNKSLEKYFSLSDTTYLVGLCALVAGFVLLWLGWAYNYWMFIAGIVVLAVGMALFIFGSIGRVNPDAVDNKRDVALEDFGREQLEDARLEKRLSAHVKPVYVVQYAFAGEGLESRKSRDGVWRTSYVSAFRIFFTHDGIVVLSRVFSLLDDHDERHEAKEYKYSELGRAEIVRDSVRLASGKQKFTVSRARLHITDASGNDILLAQVHDDMDADILADTINRTIEHGSAS